jgi:hypothetical protein
MHRVRQRLAWLLFAAGLWAYGTSFVIPAYRVFDDTSAVHGFEACEFVYAALLDELARDPRGQPPVERLVLSALCFANPAFLVGATFFMVRRPRWAALFCTAAGVAAASYLGEQGLLMGYYLWLSAMILVAAAGVLVPRTKHA